MNVEMVGVWLGADMDLDMELTKTTNKYSWLWTSSMANQYFTPLPHMSSSPPLFKLRCDHAGNLFKQPLQHIWHSGDGYTPQPLPPPLPRRQKARVSARASWWSWSYWQRNDFFSFFLDSWLTTFFFSLSSSLPWLLTRQLTKLGHGFSPSWLELMSVVIDIACSELLLAAAQTILHVGVNNVRSLVPGREKKEGGRGGSDRRRWPPAGKLAPGGAVCWRAVRGCGLSLSYMFCFSSV